MSNSTLLLSINQKFIVSIFINRVSVEKHDFCFSFLFSITWYHYEIFFFDSINCNRNVTTSFHYQNSIIRKVVFTLKVVFYPSAYISLWTAVCHWIQKHRFTVKNRSSLEKCSYYQTISIKREGSLSIITTLHFL